VNPWIRYSLVRLGLFAAAFTVLSLVLPAPLAAVEVTGFAVVVVAAAVAAVIALTVSYIFFGQLRHAVAMDLAERRGQAAHDPDALEEDSLVDERSPERTNGTP
jgi:hypothetical protein